MQVIGEVVEVYERGGVRHMKVALRSCCVDLVMADGRDYHLGDGLAMDVELSVAGFRPHPDPGVHPSAGKPC